MNKNQMIKNAALRRVKRPLRGPPVFTPEEEGTPEGMHRAFHRNQRFATKGPYQTHLGPHGERKFEHWAAKTERRTGTHIPLHGKTDYDYRGFYQKNRGIKMQPGQHYPDRFKTPYDTTFSRESKYSADKNPLVWHGNKLINKRSRRIVAKGG